MAPRLRAFGGMPIAEVPRELWAHRELIYQLTLRDVKIRYKQSLMGFAWALVMPAVVILAGSLVRSAMAYLSGDSIDLRDIAGVAVKAVPWSFVVSALGFASLSLTANAALITKIYFPREVLPLAAIGANAFDAAVAATVLAIALVAVGIVPRLTWLWVLPLAVVLLLIVFGAALLFSAANILFRDVKYLVQMLLTFGIFFTPVFFEPAMFGPTGAWVMMLNPLSPILEGVRLAVVEGATLLDPIVQASPRGDIVTWSPFYLLYALACASALFGAGVLVFRAAEPRFAEFA